MLSVRACAQLRQRWCPCLAVVMTASLWVLLCRLLVGLPCRSSSPAPDGSDLQAFVQVLAGIKGIDRPLWTGGSVLGGALVWDDATPWVGTLPGQALA